MGKIASSGKRGRSGDTPVWGSTDHAVRKAKQERKLETSEKQQERERRSALLTRGSKQKKEEGKIRLHIKRVQRQIDTLRKRLEKWDDEEEKRLRKAQEAAERKRLAEEINPPEKKKGRKGPETWKLKGAARPAHLVYDFDTRYVDPHIKAHEDAKKKAQRCRNIFAICKGKFGEEGSGAPQPFCREFLSLLTQLGNLSMEGNQLKTARQAFLECMELDSPTNPITPVRCKLMRMYLESNRPDSARRLWERLPEDSSVWIRYSAALIEYVSWKILGEEGSTAETAELLLAQAIKANLFCAYYLAFCDTFNDVMDYTEDIEDAHEGFPLEEAIEYCNSEQMGAWQGTEGALEWLRNVMLQALHSSTVANGELLPSDLEWRQKLANAKEQSEADEDSDDEADEDSDDEADKDSDDEQTSDEEGSKADAEMFAGMFETAMEMLEEAGAFRKK
jgi:hypothetical protein